MDNLLKEKRVYFLFSRMNTDQSVKVIYSIVLDYFIHTKNAYSNLLDISKSIISERQFNFSPELLQETLLSLNYLELFENFLPEKPYDEPFKMKRSVFEDISNFTNYVNLLNDYVNKFLGSKGYPKKRTEEIIEILLETIYARNINYLKKVLSGKEEKKLKLELQLTNRNVNYARKPCEFYNEMIVCSDKEFDDILRVLILKMFDFLSLNYNPKHRETVTQRFGGKVFYLDSSFILRLFGFDNEVREDRSIKLIEILKEIKDVEFVVHKETISEAQFRIKEIINFNIPLINQRERVITKIAEYIPEKRADALNLFFRLKKSGKVSNGKDFLLYFSNIEKMLKDIFGTRSFKIDDKAIKNLKANRHELIKKLSHTDKSKFRIKHIVRLLGHIEYHRGANNYNPFDIKYWLLTTDNKTIETDYELNQSEEQEYKSVCILPTELIRMIDGAGEITGNHVAVFKKFMLHSHVFVEKYSKEDIDTIDRIATLVDTVDIEKYDVNTMIENLFEKNSLEDIQKRLRLIENEKEKNKELVEIFNEANEGYIETKFTKVLTVLSTDYERDAKIIFVVSVFLLPACFFIYIFFQVINFHLTLGDPKTYINKDNWGTLDSLIAIFNGTILLLSLWVNSKYKHHFANWYVKKKIRKYK